MPNRQSGNSGMQYVDRGDVAAYDFAMGDLTIDGNWYDLDLSSIIPANVALVLLYVDCQENSGYKYYQLRTKGYLNGINIEYRRSIAANKNEFQTLLLVPDSNRFIEYMIESATWSLFNIVIRGWFV